MRLLFPDLQRFPDRRRRRAALRRALSVAQWTPWYMLTAALLVGAYAFVIFSLGSWGVPIADWGRIRGWGMVVLLVAGLGLLLMCRRAIRRSLWRDLNNAGVPTCTHCGYDLRGSERVRCSECGAIDPMN